MDYVVGTPKSNKLDGPSKHSGPRLRVCFCWSSISGYMAACWRALAQEEGIDLFVLAYAKSEQYEFSHQLMRGLNWLPIKTENQEDIGFVGKEVESFRPDVVVIAGWFNAAYRQLVHLPTLSNTRFIMVMDTQWNGSVRQRLARYVLKKFFSRISVVMVAGERSWQYARVLGFSEKHVKTGAFGVDHATYSSLYDARINEKWPKRFLFVGRYVEEKGLDILIDAYRRYRKEVEDPWPLTCCGKGNQGSLLQEEEGIDDLGFQQPEDLKKHFRKSGVFILPSRYEPWGVAIVEACAAGLPIITSSASGAGVECVRDCFNGRRVATEDPDSLAEALHFMHEHYNTLPLMGQRSLFYAEPFSPSVWCARWKQAFHTATN